MKQMKGVKKSSLINLGSVSDEIPLEKGIYDITDSPMVFSKKKGKKKKVWGEYASWMDLGLGPKGIKMKDVPGWNKIKAFKEWKELTYENPINETIKDRFAYHITSIERIDSILENGLLVNREKNFSEMSLTYMMDVYGMIPVFVSLDYSSYGKSDPKSLRLKIDIEGIPLVADIPSLVDIGAYIEEDGIWFKRKNRNVIDPINDPDLIHFDELLDPTNRYCIKAINATGTAAIMQNIEPSRIQVLY